MKSFASVTLVVSGSEVNRGTTPLWYQVDEISITGCTLTSCITGHGYSKHCATAILPFRASQPHHGQSPDVTVPLLIRYLCLNIFSLSGLR
jgi:hypothetical protein